MDQVQLAAMELPQIVFSLANDLRTRLWQQTGNPSFRMLMPLIPLAWCSGLQRFPKQASIPKPLLPLSFAPHPTKPGPVWMLAAAAGYPQASMDHLRDALAAILPPPADSCMPPWWPNAGMDGIWLGCDCPHNATDPNCGHGSGESVVVLHTVSGNQDHQADAADADHARTEKRAVMIKDAHILLLDIDGDWHTRLSYRVIDRMHLA